MKDGCEKLKQNLKKNKTKENKMLAWQYASQNLNLFSAKQYFCKAVVTAEPTFQT